MGIVVGIRFAGLTWETDVRTIVLNIQATLDMDDETLKVLGYLMTWACHSEKYAHLTIFQGRDDEIHAAYREKADGPVTFFMAAIRDEEGDWSTHS